METIERKWQEIYPVVRDDFAEEGEARGFKTHSRPVKRFNAGCIQE
jgi:hypothetical protein